jgi:DNA-binding response OmpR family regulator
VALILIIDDDEQVLRTMKWALEKHGHHVMEIQDGRGGLALYRNLPVDIVITDILMPYKDGLDIVVEIRSEFPDAKIVAMSGGGPGMPSEGCLHLATDLGANEVLTKPIEKKQLLELIDRLLSHQAKT